MLAYVVGYCVDIVGYSMDIVGYYVDIIGYCMDIVVYIIRYCGSHRGFATQLSRQSLISTILQFIPLVLSLVLLFLQMTAQPYKDKWANTAETFTLFCLVALLALGNTTPVIIASRQLPEFTLWPLFFLPVAVGGVLAIAFTTYIIG